MAFSRNNYDSCAYDLKIKRSTDQGDYRLYSNFAENINPSYSYNGPIGSKSDVSIIKNLNETCFGNMAEIESDLSWRNNKLDRCNDKKFNKFPVIDKPICASNLATQDTRFTNPIDNYRGMSLTNYMLTPYLFTNPQCYIQDTRDLVGSNTRLESKDCFDLKTNISNNPSNKNPSGGSPSIVIASNDTSNSTSSNSTSSSSSEYHADNCAMFHNEDHCVA